MGVKEHKTEVQSGKASILEFKGWVKICPRHKNKDALGSYYKASLFLRSLMLSYIYLLAYSLFHINPHQHAMTSTHLYQCNP